MESIIEKKDLDRMKSLLDFSFNHADLKRLSHQEMNDLGCLNDYLCDLEIGIASGPNNNLKNCVRRVVLVINHLYAKNGTNKSVDFIPLDTLNFMENIAGMESLDLSSGIKDLVDVNVQLKDNVLQIEHHNKPELLFKGTRSCINGHQEVCLIYDDGTSKFGIYDGTGYCDRSSSEYMNDAFGLDYRGIGLSNDAVMVNGKRTFLTKTQAKKLADYFANKISESQTEDPLLNEKPDFKPKINF